ncbi:MAG: LysE family transporter [Chloroflexota bacterium]
MELAALFITAYVVGFSGALMPGPLTTVTIESAAKQGFRAGLLPTAGHAIAEAAVVVGLALGLSRLLGSDQVMGTIALVGGAVLVWLGYGMGRGAWLGQVSLTMASASAAGGLGPVSKGVAVSIVNPYWIIWWATVGATYVVAALQWGAAGVALFFTGHILADLTWTVIVAGVIARGRQLLGERAYRGLILACGVFLVVLGLGFAVSGVGFLRGQA